MNLGLDKEKHARYIRQTSIEGEYSMGEVGLVPIVIVEILSLLLLLRLKGSRPLPDWSPD